MSASPSAVTGSPDPPSSSQSEPPPCSRSASAAWLVRRGSGSLCRWRTSQPETVAPCGRAPRTNGGKPGRPGSAGASSAVYSGRARSPSWSAVPSACSAAAPSSGCAPALRSTPSTRVCHCARWAAGNSAARGSPSGGTVMPRRLAPARGSAGEAKGVTLPSLCTLLHYRCHQGVVRGCAGALVRGL